MPRGLFILLGASFRHGGQTTTIAGIPESYEQQKVASISHMALFKHIKNTQNIDSDVYIHTYSTQNDNELISWYGTNLIRRQISRELIGYSNLYFNSIDAVNDILNNYDFVQYIRIDLILQPFFINIYQIYDTIKYSFICFIPHHKLPNGMPRVADLIAYIPRKHYNILYKKIQFLCHEGYDFLIKSGIPKSEITFYIDTYHDSDSNKDWNPLYFIANRNRATKWHSIGYKYNYNTGNPTVI